MPSHAEVHHAHQLARRAAVRARGLELVEHRADALARRERLLDEEVLDAAVLAAAQQDHVGVIDAAPGAADLLVVGHHRAGRLEVHDEGQVGLVVAHAERAGGDHGLDLVAQQALLGGDPLLGLLLAAVGERSDAVGGEERRDLLGVALGQRVDDARARQRREVLHEPREPLRRARQLERLEAQARARERPAVGAQRLAVLAGELLHRRRATTRSLAVAVVPSTATSGAECVEHVLHAPVVGAEVVPPVRYAVRLVDHQQPDRGREQRQHVVAEAAGCSAARG